MMGQKAQLNFDLIIPNFSDREMEEDTKWLIGFLRYLSCSSANHYRWQYRRQILNLGYSRYRGYLRGSNG